MNEEERGKNGRRKEKEEIFFFCHSKRLEQKNEALHGYIVKQLKKNPNH